MEPINRRLGVGFLLACLFLSLQQKASAVVVFSSDGDDLLITIQDPIEITSLVSHSSSIMGLAFIDVYQAQQLSNFPGNYGDATLQTPGGSSSLGRGAGILGNYGLTSIYVLFGELSAATFSFSVSPGDSVVITPGTRTLPGFLANSPFPDTEEKEISVYLISQFSHPRPPDLGFTTVDVELVPEPELHFLIALPVLTTAFSRRRITNRRIGSPGVISSRVPHHPAYGSVQGGSNQTRAFGP